MKRLWQTTNKMNVNSNQSALSPKSNTTKSSWTWAEQSKVKLIIRSNIYPSQTNCSLTPLMTLDQKLPTKISCLSTIICLLVKGHTTRISLSGPNLTLKWTTLVKAASRKSMNNYYLKRLWNVPILRLILKCRGLKQLKNRWRWIRTK